MSEHLVAIALHSGTPKDQARILRFLDSDAVDGSTLQSILQQYGLTDRWNGFEGNYVEKFPSEQETRKRLTALSFSEKVKILEKLRDREKAIAASGLRRTGVDKEPRKNRDGH